MRCTRRGRRRVARSQATITMSLGRMAGPSRQEERRDIIIIIIFIFTFSDNYNEQ